MSTRVLLADDQTLVRSGFRELLERTDGIDVIGEASDGAAAFERARADRPDVVLMDIRMPGMDGLEATRKIAADRNLSDVRVIMLTTFDLDEYVFEALRAGASGFLLKSVEPDELRNAVRVVAGGDALLSPSVTRQLISDFASQPGKERHPPAELEELTEREREVLGLMAEGRSNQAIAEQLVVTERAVEKHVTSIFSKLELTPASEDHRRVLAVLTFLRA